MPVPQGFPSRADSERIVALTCDGEQQLGRRDPMGGTIKAICLGVYSDLPKSPADERPAVHHGQDETANTRVRTTTKCLTCAMPSHRRAVHLPIPTTAVCGRAS